MVFRQTSQWRRPPPLVADGTNAIIMGPVGVGKTFLPTALGYAAVRARHSVHFERAGQLLKRLRAARLDNSHDEQVRKLLHTDPPGGRQVRAAAVVIPRYGLST